jgi:hypothetical protein
MADTVKTIGSAGDYADPILWAAGQGGVNDGNRQVGEMLEDITINALFRPNQAFVNGGLLRGDNTVTGEIGVGRTLTNLASTRYCLAPSANLNFEDFYASDGGVTKTTTFQNISGNDFTRFISTDIVSGGSVNPVTDTTSTTLTNCVVYSVVQNNSTTAGSVTLNNALVMSRIIARANNLLTFANSISLAADWYLGQPTDTGAVSLVNDCRILENANANEFGPGSSGNVVNYDATSDFVNYAGGDYRISTGSALHPLNIGPFFEVASGISIVGDTALFDFNALSGAVELGGEILVIGSTASFDYSAISGSVDLTGQLLVIGDTANFDCTALSGGVDLTGEIIVTGSTANFDCTGENGIVELGAVINVVGQTANFDFNGVNAEVSLTGEIIIIGDTATFNYQALSGLVIIGQGQKIGTVTAGFAESTIGVQYKQSTITVNFGE